MKKIIITILVGVLAGGNIMLPAFAKQPIMGRGMQSNMAMQSQWQNEQQGNENEIDNGRQNLNPPIFVTSTQIFPQPATTTRRCMIGPPGHFIAPGWIRNFLGGILPIPCRGQFLPPGIARKIIPFRTFFFHQPATSTLATSQVASNSITDNSAHVTWTTNVPATSQVFVSTNSPVIVPQGQAPNASSNTLTTNHDLTLTNLNPSTTYHFFVVSSDASGRTITSGESSFTTLGGNPGNNNTTSTPSNVVVSQVMPQNITANSVHIHWTTNVPTTSQVWYSTSTPIVVTTNTPSVSSATLTNDHDILISNLSANTTYHFFVVSSDAAGNTTASPEMPFTTTQ